MPRLTRVETRALTRRALIDAAAHEFASVGFAGASVDAIAARAGYTRGAVYANFANKQALLLELMKRFLETELENSRAVFERAESVDDMLAEAEAQIDAAAEDDALWPMLGMELQLQAARDPEFRALYNAELDSFHEALGRLLDRAFAARGKAAPLTPHALGALMRVTGQGAALISIGRGERAFRAGALFTLIFRGLLEAAEAR